jgi:hypothetical protein
VADIILSTGVAMQNVTANASTAAGLGSVLTWTVAVFSDVEAVEAVVLLHSAAFLNVTSNSSSAVVRLTGPALPYEVRVLNASALSVRLSFAPAELGSAEPPLTVSVVVLQPLLVSCVAVALGMSFTILPVDDTAGVVAKTSTSVAAVVSVVTLNPTAAVQSARLGALQSISACVGLADDSVPIGFGGGSFTGMVVGSGRGKYLVGGVVGNGLLVVAGSAVLVALMLVWGATECLKQEAAARGASTLAQKLREACEVGRVPSVYFAVYMVFAPPTVGFGTSLLQITPALPENVLVGSVAVAVGILYPTLVTINLARNFRCSLGPTSASRATRVAAVDWLCRPKLRWTSAPEEAAWRRRNRLYFDDFDRWWYGLLDLWTTLLVGLVNGVNIAERVVCAAQIGVILFVFAGTFILGVLLDPCMSRSLRYYLNMSNFCGLVASCMLVAAVQLDSPQLLDASNWLMTGLSIVSILKLLVDVVYVIFRFLRTFDVSRKRRSSVAVVVVTGAAAGQDAAVAATGQPDAGQLTIPLLDGERRSAVRSPSHASSCKSIELEIVTGAPAGESVAGEAAARATAQLKVPTLDGECAAAADEPRSRSSSVSLPSTEPGGAPPQSPANAAPLPDIPSTDSLDALLAEIAAGAAAPVVEDSAQFTNVQEMADVEFSPLLSIRMTNSSSRRAAGGERTDDDSQSSSAEEEAGTKTSDTVEL